MTKKRVITRPIGVLLWASLLNWTTGNGLFPLLPLYALERGATIEAAGMVLAIGFVGLAAGSIIAARLTRIVGSRKRAYIGAALLQALAYALLGRATEAWQLLILLPCAWLGAGVATTTVQVLAGLATSAERRGRVFGMLALAPPVGAMIGATVLGALAARNGYGAAFDAGALLVLGAAFVMAAGMPADEPFPTPEPAARRVRAGSPRSGVEMLLLLGALLAATALFFGRLTTPVFMHALSFDPQAIAATAAVGGLVTVPFVLLLSDLSDRLGRRPMLIATYGLIALASGILALADQPWHFYLAAALLSLGFAASGSVTAALAGDLLPPTALPAALGRLSAITWIAAVIAFAGGGALLSHVSAPALCLGAALLALSAGMPLAFLRRTFRVARAWQARSRA
jgi:MFS family permease